MSKEYKCAPPQSTRPSERWGQHAHPNARARRSLTGSSRGLYKRNGDLIAIPHKVAGANWKLVEDQANKVTVNRCAPLRERISPCAVDATATAAAQTSASPCGRPFLCLRAQHI